MAKGKYNARKRKVKKNVPSGVVHIQSSFNNTVVTITDALGNALCWASSGTQGIKGSKKSTPYAAGKSAEIAGTKAVTEFGMKKVEVIVKGLGGIKELIDRKTIFPECMLIGEPTYNEKINSSKGVLEFKVTFSGVTCHSSTPEKGVNAIEKCVCFIKKLQDFYTRLKKETENKDLTMNIGIINGGSGINVVPGSCELFFDFRTTNVNQISIITDKVNKLSVEFNGQNEIINNVKPFTNPDEEINRINYTTEASFIEGGRKYILGVGPVNAHIKDEFISIESLEKLEKQYLEIIEKQCEKE